MSDKINRKEFLKRAGAIGAGAALSSVPVNLLNFSCKEPESSVELKEEPGASIFPELKQPNFLFIMTDQERNHRSLPEGVTFPNHERLMRQSVNFRNFHVATSPCGPSRSCIFTGQHIQKTGVTDNPRFPRIFDMDPDIPTIGTMLREQGYDTVYKGKWDICKMDYLQSSPGDLEQYGFSDWGEYGDKIGGGYRVGYDWDPRIAKDAREWLLNRSKSPNKNPWLLVVSLVNPHDIMFHSLGSHQLRTCKNPVVRKNIGCPVKDEIYRHQWNKDLPRSYYISKREIPESHKMVQLGCSYLFGEIPLDDKEQWKEFQNHYFNCIMDVDRHLGTVLDALEQSGMAENTVVIYTSDHGEMAGAHRMRSKVGNVYKETFNVPLMVRIPGITKGANTDAIASAIDLAPTILAMAGVDTETRKKRYPALHGFNLSPAILNPQSEGARFNEANGLLMNSSNVTLCDIDFVLKTFSALGKKSRLEKISTMLSAPITPALNNRAFIRGVFDGRYKFARYFAPNNHHLPIDFDMLKNNNDLELYDTIEDPDELNNLAFNTKKYRDLILVMNEKLNNLIHREVGEDDGSYMPGPGFWWRA